MDTRNLSVLQKLLLIVFVSFLCMPMTEGDNSLREINRNEMGMESLFKMVHVFLGDIVQSKNISDSFLNLSTVFVDGDFDRDALTDWQEWANYLIGFAVCVCIGLLFIVVMPIAGIVFCCCRLCGKCGGQKRPHETKRSKCKRRTYCTLLVLFNTLALAGVVCAFICNDLIYKNLKNDKSEGLVGHIQYSLQEIENFANDAVQNVSTTAIRTVEGVSANVVKEINDTGMDAIDKALATLNATVYLNEAERISMEVNQTKERLDKVNNLLKVIVEDTTELERDLSEIAEIVKAACTSPSDCPFKEDNYKPAINFTQLGDLSSEASKVTDAMNMDQFIATAKASISDAQATVRTQIDKQVESASTSIKNVNESVMNGIKNLERQRDDAVSYLRDAHGDLNDTDQQLKDHADYVYYGGIGVCCVYLLIVVLYYVGLLFGLCGERPGDGAPCCNRGAGSKFLMGGISMTFIFSWILMLLCTILFIVGGMSYTEVCRYFVDHDPRELKIFDNTLDKGLDLSGAIFTDKTEKFSLSDSLRECQDNQAVYTAFKLEHVVDLDNLTNLQSLKSELDKLKEGITLGENITIIDEGLRQSLKKFSEAGLDNVDFSKFINETEKNITTVDLKDLADRTRTLSGAIEVQTAANRLDNLAKTVIPKVQSNMTDLRLEMIALQQDNSSHSDSINKLITGLQTSQDRFNADKNTLTQEAVSKLADRIFDDTRNKVDSLTNEIKNDIGHCERISAAFFSLTDSACVLAVDPLNGLWFSFGWCLFFFILCLVFAIPLTTIYRCEHKYEKEFDDPNYVMYGGPNPDTIPLTSVERLGGQPQRHPHHSGMANSAYSPETKPYFAPPPYRESMRQGIAAYAYPPPDYNGHQHHDLATAYPALHKSGDHPGHRESYNYPY